MYQNPEQVPDAAAGPDVRGPPRAPRVGEAERPAREPETVIMMIVVLTVTN